VNAVRGSRRVPPRWPANQYGRDYRGDDQTAHQPHPPRKHRQTSKDVGPNAVSPAISRCVGRVRHPKAVPRQHLASAGEIWRQTSTPVWSVATGDALASCDIDLLVDMGLDGKDALWELSGLTEELRELLGVRVDVACEKLLRQEIVPRLHHSAVAPDAEGARPRQSPSRGHMGTGPGEEMSPAIVPEVYR
jgi:uncharacterized protein